MKSPAKTIMNFQSTFRWLTLSIVIAAFGWMPSMAPAYNGMSYTSWSQNALFASGSEQSIINMSSIGVDTVALNIWAFQDDENSTDIALDFNYFSSSLPSIEHAIDEIHANGMQVMLKPNVDLRNGVWRAFINPSPGWFSSYTNFMNDWADFAEQNGVAMLSVGTEYRATESAESDWRNVISNVRSRYSGDLTYSANHDSYETVAWWDDLDYIGIDAYFPLTNQDDPTTAQLEAAWNSRANSIENWRASEGLSQPVLFTEVGYSSFDGANQTPWATPGNGDTVDVQEQADAYAALLSTMNQRDWWDGAFWWNWETNPNAGGPNDRGHTPQGKPAEDVLSSFYLTSLADADLNFDLSLDALDWTLFIDGHKVDLSGLSPIEQFQMGDLDGDGDNDFDDFVRFEFVYDDVNGSGAFASMLSNIPEPGSSTLAFFAVCFLLNVARRKGRLLH